MASGVRLFLAVLVCASCTGLSFQDKVDNILASSFNNKTDKHLTSEIQSDNRVKNVSGAVNNVEDSRDHVPEFVREEKGAPPRDSQVVGSIEANELLKGEPVLNNVFDNANIREAWAVENEVPDNVAEAVDPVYQLEDELKMNHMYGKNASANSSVLSDTDVKSRIKRSEFSEQSTELVARPFGGTTEVADLLSAPSDDQEVAAGHKSHKWSKGGGHKYKKEHHKKGGHKGDKGYKKKHHHKKGEHEKHGKDEHKKHYKKHSGHKKKHHDEAEKYGEHHKKEKGHKGAKYGEKKGHKKGHKTKGYHHKFHKDEYKKEHKFYDDYHKKGHHDKHGHHHKHHAKKAGKHKKGGHHKLWKERWP
ncbi:hypothetical protein WDU94_011257 [Cyamophila willieti]